MFSLQFVSLHLFLVFVIFRCTVDCNQELDVKQMLLKHDELINELITENVSLKTRLKKNENTIDELERELAVVQKNEGRELGTTDSSHDLRRFVFDNGMAEFGYKIAFTAKLNVHMRNIGLHQTIVFEKVHTNQGNAYSPDTGVFAAPVNGTYFFTCSIMCHSGDFVEVEMVHNGQHVVYMYASDTNFEQGTNSAVIVLNQGDHVWIRNARKETNQIYGYDWSTFTGFLIYTGDINRF